MSNIDLRLADSAEFREVKRWRGGPEWHPRPHSHPFCELIVVIGGAERAVIGKKAYICETGEVLFYPPGHLHAEWQHGPTLLDFYCVEFDWPDCPRDFPHVLRDRQGRLMELARWLNADSLPMYEGCDSYRQFATRLLAGELLRLIVSPAIEVVDVIRKHVRENLCNPLSLDELALASGLNKFHLVRRFRTATGFTPMEYVRSVRLDTALRLLAETSLPLREIAPQVGFSDEYHLSRLLKARYGRGARELRRQARDEAH